MESERCPSGYNASSPELVTVICNKKEAHVVVSFLTAYRAEYCVSPMNNEYKIILPTWAAIKLKLDMGNLWQFPEVISEIRYNNEVAANIVKKLEG